MLTKREEMNPSRSLAQLSVWLGQTLVGSITELPNDRNLFVFDRSYLDDAQRPVLSLSFYDAEGQLDPTPIQTQTKVAPFFSNLLPEEELRRYVAQRAGVKGVRDLPLLQLLGEDLPGAVVVRAESEGPPEEDPFDEVSPAKVADESRPLRFSLAGVQMKFSAAGSPDRGLTIPAEGRGGHWILKLPSDRYPLVPENEHSMMQFARAVGIETADTGLIPVNEIGGLPQAFQRKQENALWVKRFDRTPNNTRLHMEDFNQLYRQYPAQKYNNYSYGNMAGDLARIIGFEAVQEFVRRLVFSAAIGNADMHLKNWTLLYADGRTPKLSPAYDLVSTISYIEDFTMSLSIAKEKDVRKFDETLLRRFAAKLPVPERFIFDAALHTAEQIVQTWPQIRDDLPMTSEAKDRVMERILTFPLTQRFVR
jgi:serine/threonine-protein kinase HipA